MHIAMDAREAIKTHRTGKGQWAHGFLQELKKRDITLTLLTRSHLKTTWTLFHIKPDLYFSPTSYIIPALMGRWLPCAVVLHDLIAFHREPHDFKAKWIERLTLRWALKYSKYVFTVSEATKRDLFERFPWVDEKKVKVIYAGPSFETSRPLHFRSSGSIDDPLRLSNRSYGGKGTPQHDTCTILCVGTLCPRKNQLRLIEAFERISLPLGGRARERGSNVSLVLAGSRGWHDDAIVKKTQSNPGVTWLGHISDVEYQNLLASATIFALPSLYEGFGLAILDAMAMGIPILTSNRGALKEVAGDAAMYVDPENIDSIAQGLKRLLKDTDLRSELSEKGKRQAQKFSWKKTVDLFMQWCKYPSRREGTQGRGSR